MGSGKVGVNTGTIINVRYRRNKKPRPCDCSKCKSARVVDGVIYCMLSGDIGVKKRTCKFYSGPFIKAPQKYKKHKQRKKVKRRPGKSNS